VAVAAGTAEDADEELELRVPLGIVAFLSLPAMMLWVLAGVLIAAGQVLNVAVLGAVATSVLVIRFGRTGATVDLDGIEVRTVAATWRFRWRDVEGFSVLRVARGQLLVNVVGGESLAIAGPAEPGLPPAALPVGHAARQHAARRCCRRPPAPVADWTADGRWQLAASDAAVVAPDPAAGLSG